MIRIILRNIAPRLVQCFELFEPIDNLVPLLGRDQYSSWFTATHQYNWRRFGHFEDLVLLAP